MVMVKKKAPSKRNKASWRKHVDISDVDTFLEEKRLEERLGEAFENRPDNDLFIIDTKPSKGSKKKNIPKLPKISSKQQKRELIKQSLKDAFLMLKPHSQVPDPISKRNRVRTKEERKDPIRKKKEAALKLQGKLTPKQIQSRKDKALFEEKKKNKPKKGDFNKDIWMDEKLDKIETDITAEEWFSSNTKLHNLNGLGRTKKQKKPGILSQKTSLFPSIETPHPGMSYNPSLEDHQNLLRIVAEKETKIIKTEKHLQRVTNAMFRKVTPEEKQKSWVEEMSEGLPSKGIKEEESESEPEVESSNTLLVPKQKTMKQRRKQKEQRIIAQSRIITKNQKKKLTDLHILKKLQEDVKGVEKQEKYLKQRLAKIKTERQKKTKQLSRRKFEEPDLEFKMGNELSGNLRDLKKEGDLLKDRFLSLRKRNVLEVTERSIKRRAKIKRFVRSGHKDDWKSNIASLKSV